MDKAAAIYVLAIAGALSIIRRITRFCQIAFTDRNGNSGRFRHWSKEDE
jgi:hypothetical protein